MSSRARRSVFRIASSFLLLALVTTMLWASVGGSISGTVKDPAGNVVVNAEVTVRESGTGISHVTHTDNKGYFTFPVLPVGHYTLDVEAPGFGKNERKDITLDTSAALTLNTVLEVGSVSSSVTVTDNTLHVETTSTQMGQVITGRQMTAVPLDGRSFTDLLSLQPGVAPQTSISDTTVQDVGATVLNPSGTLNPGNLSVNGQRESANYFSVNGSDVEEDVNAGTAVIPNLDSIAEFRIITSNFDAEYGEFSGGQISVVTKSGSNAFHGNAFDFLRNTDLDARNYFSPTRGAFRQNQFGGTLGGPIRRDKCSSSWTIRVRGRRRASIPALSRFRAAQIARETSPIYRPVQLEPSDWLVSGPYFATVLTQKLGYQVAAGEPYYVPGCTSSSSCVFPNGVIPQMPGRFRRRACCSTFQLRIPPTAFPPRPSTRRCAMTKARCASMEIPRWDCCPATTLSTTSIWTILTR